MCDNCRRESGFFNPFNLPPYPNMILVGRGEEQPFFQIWKDGRVELMDDPLGHPIATFGADDLELLKFLASHIEHYSLEPGAQAQDAPEIPEHLKTAVKLHNGNGNGNGHKKPAGKTGAKETRNASAGELAGANVGMDGSNGQPTLSQAWLNR